MTRCLDIVDAVSLIPYRGIFEHRMLKPAIILFPSFTKQILWVSCQLGSLGSTCWSGVRRITPGTNSGGWGKTSWSRSYGKPLDWDASLEPVEREGIKDDWVVQTLCSYGKKLCSFGRPGALVQSRTVGESDRPGMENLLVTAGLSPGLALPAKWVASAWNWGRSSGQLKLEVVNCLLFCTGSVRKGDLSTVPPLAPWVSNVSGTVCLFSLLLGLNMNLRKLPSLQIFCCYCLWKNSSACFIVFLWGMNECVST